MLEFQTYVFVVQKYKEESYPPDILQNVLFHVSSKLLEPDIFLIPIPNQRNACVFVAYINWQELF